MEDINVIDWLNYCDENNIKPWLWDFKNYSLSPFQNDSITAFLKYKELPKNEGIDCDKAAFYLYQMLGWQNSVKDIIRGETMNSFITTFNEAIKDSSDYYTIANRLGKEPRDRHIPYSTLYQNQNYLMFDNIQNNLDDFQKFATLTHTIENFTVLPSWMNTGRYYFSRDYWDITLLSLQEWLNILSPDAWTNFVETYYLQPYVNTEYNVELFWEGHDKKILPKKENYPVFLKKVNERIEERGKYIIKQICNKLNKTDFNFYTDLETMDRIKFSNEL